MLILPYSRAISRTHSPAGWRLALRPPPRCLVRGAVLHPRHRLLLHTRPPQADSVRAEDAHGHPPAHVPDQLAVRAIPLVREEARDALLERPGLLARHLVDRVHKWREAQPPIQTSLEVLVLLPLHVSLQHLLRRLVRIRWRVGVRDTNIKDTRAIVV